MAERPLPPAGPSPGEAGACAGARVLVVDDNALFARATAALLATLGARADLAADGFAALGALARAPYDLVLLDWEMPRLDGRRTALEIRRRHGPTPPVVVISAHAGRVWRTVGPGSGVDAVLAKPFDRGELAATLARFLPRAPAEGEGEPAREGPRPPR